MCYHCTFIGLSTDIETVTQEVVFVSLCGLPKGYEFYNWPSPLASTSSLSIFSTLIFMLLLVHRFEYMGLNLRAFVAHNRVWLKLVLASGYPGSPEIM
jgi:hypothetical protein